MYELLIKHDYQQNKKQIKSEVKTNLNIYLNTLIQILIYPVLRKVQTRLYEMFINRGKSVLTFPKKLQKYRNTVLFKY